MFDKIPYDKKLHFLAGFLITFLVSIITSHQYLGLILGILAGIGKEIRDEMVYGGFDWKDMVVTWVGCVIAYMVYISI